MRIRAKFYVSETTRRAATKGVVSVVMQPVTRGQENAEWSQYTPSGRIEMTITKGEAGALFEAHLGDEFYLTFELADDQPAGS